jgi:hypothetical protein
MPRPPGRAVTFQQHPVLLPPSLATWSNPPKKQGYSFANASKEISRSAEGSSEAFFHYNAFAENRRHNPIAKANNHDADPAKIILGRLGA